MDKVLLKTTVELRTIENVIKTNEEIRNALYDQKRTSKRNKDKVAWLNEQIKKQDKVLQELRSKRLELIDMDARTGLEIAKTLSMVYVSCDVIDNFVWRLKELLMKYCNVESGFEPLDEMLEAKRVISTISNNFVNDNLRVYNLFDSLSEGVCKAIADAVTAQAEELINS